MIGYVICESAEEAKEIKIISTAGRRVVAQGILQDMDTDNRNGRYYASKDLKPELTSARMKELIPTGNLKGEDGHPTSKDIAVQQTVNPKYTCVKYLDIWTEGNDIKAKFVGTNNSYGEAFNQDLLDGELPSFSLRALGTIENSGGHAYVRNIKIVTWDRVYYPSHKRAYTEKLVTESAIGFEGNKTVYTKEDSGLLIPITNEKVIDYIKQESGNLKTIMNNFDTLVESVQLIDRGTKVQIMDKGGNLMILNLEAYIHNDIMDYCYKK
jgi:hypothetical protein